MITHIKMIIIGLMLAYSNILDASVIGEIYTTQVEVTSKEISQEQRNLIIQQEFAKTLRKLTGKNKSIPITDAENYVSKYEYQDLNNDSRKIVLNIHFDKQLIQQKLTENQELFLPEYRPITIIWPKANNPIVLEIVQGLLQKISLMAKDYGLSVVYPVLDLHEVAMLNQDQADNDLKNAIKNASKKYDAEEIILADCNTEQELLNITWKSLINGWEFKNQVLENYTADNNLNQTAAAVILLEKLMENFIKLHNNNYQAGKEIILLRIAMVNNLENYVKVEKYLQNLNLITNLYASGFKDGEVEFKIIAAGGKQAIKNALANNRLLHENDAYNHETINSYQNNLLTYTLNL